MHLRPTCSACSLFIGALVFSLLTASTLHAQYRWEQSIEGLEGATVHSLVINTHGFPVISTGHGIYVYGYDRHMETLEWTRVDTGKPYAQLHRSPSGRLFALVYDGIYASENAGMDWYPIFEGPVSGPKVIGDSTVLWVDGGQGRLMITNDLGRTIRSHSPNAFSYFETGSNGNLYALNATGISYSRDTGRTWTHVDAGDNIIPGNFTRLIVVEENVFIADGGGLLRSDDRGASWTRVDTFFLYDIHRGEDGVYYGLGGLDAGRIDAPYKLFTSTDAGITWSQSGTYSSPQVFGANEDGELWTAGYESVLTSADGGTRWREENTGLSNVNVEKILSDRTNGTLYLTRERSTWGGIHPVQNLLLRSLHRSTDNGTTWTTLLDTISQIKGLDSLGNLYCLVDSIYVDTLYFTPEPYLGYRTDRSIVQSRDFGATWRSLPMSSEEKEFFVDASVHSSAAGTAVVQVLWTDTSGQPTQYIARTFFVSTNSGRDWRRHTFRLHDTLQYYGTMHVRKDGSILVSDYYYDAGLRLRTRLWRYEPTTGEPALIDTLSVDRLIEGQDGLLYAFNTTDDNGRPHYSEDDGETWQPLPLPFTGRIYDLRAGPDGTIYLFGYMASDAWFGRSADRGLTWKPITTTVGDFISFGGAVPDLIANDGRILNIFHLDAWLPYRDTAAFYHFYGLVWSDDMGYTWTHDTTELHLRHATTMAFAPDGRLIVGTLRDGVFIEKSSSAVPTEPVAGTSGTLRVAPTPATESATAFFTLEKEGAVRLELFDLLGRSVGVLADRSFEAGEQRVALPVEDLTAGSYLLRLNVDGVMESVGVVVR